MAVKLSLITNGDKWLVELDSDPSIGVGFPAPIGSEAFVDDSTGSKWLKYGVLNTEWRNTSDESFDIVTFSEQVEPLPPTLGLKLYSQNVGGRQMISQVGKSGLGFTSQPHMGRNKVILWQANGNSTASTIVGSAITATGTATTRSIATTNFFTWLRRLGYVSASTANSSCGIRTTSLQFGRGNIANTGGFHFISRAGISDASAIATGRLFVGFTSSTGVLGNSNPSSLTNIIGFGCDSTDVNMQVIHAGSGVSTKIDLGASFPVNTRSTDMYEFIIFTPPNHSSVFWKITNLTSNVSASGEITSNLPLPTQLLAVQLWRHNTNTAGAVALDIVNIYIETDN